LPNWIFRQVGSGSTLLTKTPFRIILNPSQKGTMESSEVKNQKPTYVEGFRGKSVKLNGDSWLDLGGSGIFSRSDPFSVSIWISVPKVLD
jgi:hypothetical protein